MSRQRRDMGVLLGERRTEWVGVCVLGHRALRYYLMSASISNEDLGEIC